MGKRLKLFKFRGVPVEIGSISLAIILLSLVPAIIIIWLPGAGSRLNLLDTIGSAALLPVGLFLSVLLHELAHAQVGIWFGSTVTAIQANIMGGATYFAARAPAYFKDLLIMLAGPSMNALLWGLFQMAARQVDRSSSLHGILTFLAVVNLIDAFFNALPVYPLDGGQALYALLMGFTSQPKFSANLVLLTTASTMALAPFAIFKIFNGDLVLIIFLIVLDLQLALQILVNCLVLKAQATSLGNFFPTPQLQYQKLKKDALDYAAKRRHDLYYKQGQTEFQAGQYIKALGSFTKALENAPDNPEYREARANVYLLIGEDWQALADYNELLKKTSPRSELYTARARLQQKLGMTYQARQDLATALQLNPTDIKALLLQADLEEGGALAFS